MREPEIILQALLNIWEELPSLLGTEWVNLYPELDAIQARLQMIDDSAEQAKASIALVHAFRKYATARKLLRQAIEEVRRDWSDETRKGNNPSGLQLPTFIELFDGFRNRLKPPIVVRYTDITVPRRLIKGRRGVITVGLTCAPIAFSEVAQSVHLGFKTKVEVRLQAPRDDFNIIGQTVISSDQPGLEGVSVTKTLLVEQNRDSDPVVFFIEGLSQGRKSLFLTLHQAGVTIGSVWLLVEVTNDAQVDEQLQNIRDTIRVNASYGPPPDLEIFIRACRRNQQDELSFILHSPNGVAPFHNQDMGMVTLVSPPEEFQKHLIDKMEYLSARKDTDGKDLSVGQVQRKLRSIGQQLYKDLFNEQMRNAYRQFRKQVQTILITSNEPWIPWEMIRPYDSSDPNEIIDDDFLCAQFELTRWLAGRGGPPTRIDVARLACIEAHSPPNETPLQYAPTEREYLSSLAKGYGGLEDVSPQSATVVEVGKRLDTGGIGLYHIAAHGDVKLGFPNESVILLADGQRLQPEDIDGHRQTLIENDKPLIFFNICRGGQQGWHLIGLGGWASLWVDRSRCGSFIAPLWGINDRLAFEFARAFYEALREGKTIGKAVKEARAHIRNTKPPRLTWMAYSVYAHPNARVYFRDAVSIDEQSVEVVH